MSAKKRMLDYLKSNIGKEVLLTDLGKVAGVVDYTRILRALRQEGWALEHRKVSSKIVYYKLTSLDKLTTGKERRSIDAKKRYNILQRDNSICQRCGKKASDGAKLAVDHKIPVDWGGTNQDSNLWALCEECNLGKQAFFQDFDAETMKVIAALETSGERLKEFIRRNYGKPLPVHVLQVVARAREWTRTVRRLRQDGLFSYVYDPKVSTYTFKEGTLLPK